MRRRCLSRRRWLRDRFWDGRVSLFNSQSLRWPGGICSLSESSMIIGAFFLPRTRFGGCSSAWIEASESDSLLLPGFLSFCLVELAV